MPGYNTLPLQDNTIIQERLKCTHCQLIMRDPVQTKENGLLFCRECFNEVLKNPESLSLQPGDRVVWTDNAVKNEIAKLPVLCLYHEVGCQWRGLLKYYNEHISSCECRTSRHKEGSCNSVEANSDAIPVSLSGPVPSEQLMIGVGARQLSRSTEDIIPSVQRYDNSQPSPPLGQMQLNAHMQDRLDSTDSKVADLEQSLRDIANTKESTSSMQLSLATLQLAIDEIKEQLVELKAIAVSSNVSCNGKLTWPVNDVRKRFEEARLSRMVRIFSPPFYSKPDGYKMCVCLYLNGCGNGEGTHLSIFFALMKGEYDPLLQWPFEHKLNLILVDQDNKKDDIIRSFNPAVLDTFSRPTHELDSHSGFTKFAPVSILDNPKYVKDDVMFIRATMDTQDYILV